MWLSPEAASGAAADGAARGGAATPPGAGPAEPVEGADWQPSPSTPSRVARLRRTWRARVAMVALSVIVEHECNKSSRTLHESQSAAPIDGGRSIAVSRPR